MNTRLQQFLAAENITQAQFADTIKVARASVSHILAGRNKPGYDFLQNMMRYYPTLNIEWLISGKGKMYKGEQNLFSQPLPQPAPEEIPFEVYSAAQVTRQETDFSVQSPTQDANIEISEGKKTPAIEDSPVQHPVNQRKAIKIMIFYDDNTFQEFQK